MPKSDNQLYLAVFYMAVFIVFFNLIDFFYMTVIAKSPFSFHWLTNILTPALGGLLYYFVKSKLISKQQTNSGKKSRSNKRSRGK